MGLKSRGSLHKHIQGLIAAGLVTPPNRKQRGVRLTSKALESVSEIEKLDDELPLLGVIAAGQPIEAIKNISYLTVPDQLKTNKTCYVLQVKGDSMIDDGIFDGDWVVIEQREHAKNGEIVVALINKTETTLKYIQQQSDEIILIPANKHMQAMHFQHDQIEIQGVLVGQMRSYIH
jgi:repressor LexA